MGIMNQISCTACDYSVFILEGIGMEGYPPHALSSSFSNDQYKMVRREVIKERANTFSQSNDVKGYRLYACPKCHNLCDRFYFQINEGNEVYEPDYKCSHCHTILKEAEWDEENKTIKYVYEDEDVADWHCPKCGSGTIEFSGGCILWD